jgi:sugar fermentation stimulation protein A
MLFALSRPEGECFAPAWSIDPAYVESLVQAARSGVEVLAVRLKHSEACLNVAEELPVDLTHWRDQ